MMRLRPVPLVLAATCFALGLVGMHGAGAAPVQDAGSQDTGSGDTGSAATRR